MGATLYTHQSQNITKTWLLITAFLVLFIAIGYVLSVVFHNSSILIFASLFAIGTSVWSYWFSDKMVLAMTGAKKVSRENLRELYEIVDNLAITAGLPTPKIYVIDDMALNAFATGRDPKHGVIVFTRGLLERLNKEEIRGVAAHELSHIGNRDILIGTVAVIFTSIIAMTSRMLFFSGGDSRDRGNGIMMIVGLVLIVLAPLVATILRLAISRKREFLADASGALLTRYPEGLASALEKISADAQPLRSASETTAHLFIANPFKGKSFSKWFMTHPPVEERIARLRGSLDG
ncbi:zinc metalloprotease HtpX [candidate division KSB3 bacterium]|uniref:Protease HtpX homolog n=1 Tax=candidate division KSB3 bacterium TaxID=2044937 RepID=A0A2G6E021_9BACT|nr:MAG: zinc metalloprotease HtpX [candidate division KSB3 bacterium]